MTSVKPSASRRARALGTRGDNPHLGGMERAVDRSLFRVDDQFVQDAVPVEANERRVQILNPAFCASL